MFNFDISAQSGGAGGNGNIQNWACVCNWPDELRMWICLKAVVETQDLGLRAISRQLNRNG